VFALEHDLSKPEFEAASAALLARLRGGQLLEAHWLMWVVYAAELGYDFDGEEYWQSFEQRTPRWVTFGNRDLVRTWFRRFHREFAGVEPSGTWAGHFTIVNRRGKLTP